MRIGGRNVVHCTPWRCISSSPTVQSPLSGCFPAIVCSPLCFFSSPSIKCVCVCSASAPNTRSSDIIRGRSRLYNIRPRSPLLAYALFIPSTWLIVNVCFRTYLFVAQVASECLLSSYLIKRRSILAFLVSMGSDLVVLYTHSSR